MKASLMVGLMGMLVSAAAWEAATAAVFQKLASLLGQ